MSTLIKDGGPAFPHAQRLWDNDAQSWAVHSIGGMTLRDYFAAQALTGIIQRDAREGRYELLKDGHAPSVAYTAYCLADAMLAEREGKQ